VEARSGAPLGAGRRRRGRERREGKLEIEEFASGIMEEVAGDGLQSTEEAAGGELLEGVGGGGWRGLRWVKITPKNMKNR
jgi:hypothetical protein